MGCHHTRSAWSEVARVAEEYVDRGLLDEDVEDEVVELLEDGEPQAALETALEHYRERRQY
jgi:hypothetical protein